MFNRSAAVRILPFAAYIFFIFLVDVLLRFGWGAHQLRWLYGVKIAVVGVLLALFWREYGELARMTLNARAALQAVAVGALVLVLWIALGASWMQIGAPAGFDPRDAGRIDWSLVAVRVAGAALVVPVMEELFWRSFVLRWIDAPDFLRIDPARVRLRGFVVTALLFGFEHNLWLAGIVAGVAYGLLFMRSGTLWSPILAHAVTNALLAGWVLYTGEWSYW